MTATEHVILVDYSDLPVGSAEKLAAHRQGLCHRAFSVFVFRQVPELQLLLQQRADGKYHSSGLWTNTCCSHPRQNETIIAAGERRLQEEMGLDLPLKWAGKFHYIAHLENGLIENEIDHVLVSCTKELTEVPFNQDEAMAIKWLSIPELKSQLAENPAGFTPWLAQSLEIAEGFLSKM